MRIILIDPFLKNCSGHNYNYISAIRDAFEKKGINAFIWGNSAAQNVCLDIPGFNPALCSITDKVFDVTFSPGNIFGLIKFMYDFYRQFKKKLFTGKDFEIQQNDIFYASGLFVFEIFAIGFLIRAKRKELIANNCRFVLGFNYAVNRESRLLTFLMGNMYKAACNCLINGSGVNVTFFSHGELLRKDFQELFRKEVVLLPEPVYSNGLERIMKSAGRINDSGTVTVSYMGAARYNKGFDVFAGLIERSVSDPDLNGKLKFIVQVDVQKQPKPEYNRTLEAANLLEVLAVKHANILLIKGSIAIADYYRYMLESDIIVSAHREGFKTCPSRTFFETVVLGKIPVVSSDTSMSYDLIKEGLQEVVFKIGDPDSLKDTIKRALANIDSLKKKILPVQESWKRYYNADNLVETVLKG